MSELEYWKETIGQAADDCGLTMTDEQLDTISNAAMAAHENYGIAFYTPPASDHHDRTEAEFKQKYAALEREFDTYRKNAEKAVCGALRLRSGTNVTILDRGLVELL